ncbi:hypothetical protein CQ14_06540 [Bradyrhizobium lablabi]|uniref:Uncharacterized protein n=1 Tax=Bradyrhizobium lablabi TaxID=722472 RepID=A0A0R3MTL6_9BRAD|nr:hypothetical protein [Bradyrhizobium lablabi]KRR21301.1 hypothetical protein CQ14_06540 [Bradyrhizobium lablabi]
MIDRTYDPALKKGDRVVVTIPYADRKPKVFTGVIIGEARDGHDWQIVRDGTKWPRGIHKSFCKPEDVGRKADADMLDILRNGA